MALWLKDLYEDYITEELSEDVVNNNPKPIVPGGIYFGSLRSLNDNKPNKPLYFLILRKIDDNLYEVLKVSDWYLFATYSDLIIPLNGINAIVETNLNFYLTQEEISKFILIDSVSEEELKEIKEFRDGLDPTLLKKGFTPIFTPIFEDDIRNKFKQEEFNQIKEFTQEFLKF